MVALSRFELVASGIVRVGDFGTPPAPWPPPVGGEVVDDPYATGTLSHGPAFQMLRELRIGPGRSSAWLDVGRGTVPTGALGQGLLDPITHAITHDALWRWSEEIAADQIAYSHRVERLRL